MLASGSAVQKIPESPERTKKEQKTAELPIAQVNGKCFSANQWYRLKVYSPNECPSRSQPTRCQQPQTCEPQIRFFWVPEIHLIYPVGSREIDKFSGKIYFFQNRAKMAAISSENSVADPDTQKTLLLQICVVPLVPRCQKIGVRDSACSMSPASVTEFLGAEVWISFFFSKIWNIKAKFSQYCTKLTNIYIPMSCTYRTFNAEAA